MSAPLVVGIGRIGVTLSTLGANLPLSGAPAADLAALATSPAPGIAVALRAALRLGCRARAAGSHGADLLGQLARSALRDAGVETDELRAAGASACEFVHVAGDGRLRGRFGGDPGEPVVLDLDRALRDAAALLIDASAPPEQLRAARQARAAGAPVILDLGEAGDGVADLVAAADVVLASERAAGELAPRDDLADALAGLLALGPRAAVITLGAGGAIGRSGEEVIHVPAFAAEVLDDHGAGAVFHGAFAAALLSALPFERCLELGCAAAALSLGELGPWASIPSRDDVLALTRTRRRA